MIAPAPTNRSLLRGWLPVIIAGTVYLLVVCVVVVQRADSTSDFRDFWRTARHFRETGELSTDLGVHNYLPFFTLFMTPWSYPPLRVAIVLFTLLSFGLFALTVVLVETLLNGRLGPRPRGSTLAAIGLMLPYVHACGVLGQVTLLVLFVVVATWFLVERGKEWAAGAALGLAALIKLLPAALILFFLLKRRWRVASAAVGVFVALGAALPLAAIGTERSLAEHETFRKNALQAHAPRTTVLAEKPKKANYSNNSLPIVLRRLLTPVNADATDRDPERRLYVNLVDLPRRAVWWVYIGLMAVAVAVSVCAGLRGSRGWPPEDASAGLALRAQFGVWCCLMILASPLVWTHYLPLVYWPLALIADRAERVQRATKRPSRLCLSALLVWLTGALLLAWPAARAAGAQLCSVTFLWAVALKLSFERGVRAAAE